MELILIQYRKVIVLCGGAAQEGYTEIAIDLINANADVNFCQVNTGYSCLMQAITNKNADIVDLLISAKADINMPTFKEATPLMAASEIGDLDTIQKLIRAGVSDINSVDSMGFSAVHYAQANNHFRVKRFLLDNGAQPGVGQDLIPNFKGFLNLLKTRDPEKYNSLNIPLYEAVLNEGLCGGYADLCLMLHDMARVDQFHDDLKEISHWDGEDHSLDENFLLKFFSVIKLLIDAQIYSTINKDKFSLMGAPYFYCGAGISYRHVFSAGFLFKKEELEVCFREAFSTYYQFILSNSGHALSICKTEDENFIIYNSSSSIGPIKVNGYSQLIHKIFAMLGKDEAVIGLTFTFVQRQNDKPVSSDRLNNYLNLLMKKRRHENEVNLKDKDGRNALGFSIVQKNNGIAKDLIESGVEVNFNSSVPSPIYRAIQYRKLSIVKKLIDAGANLNATYKGCSLLNLAIDLHANSMAEILIERGIDVEYAHPVHLYRAIHLAARTNNTRVATYLVNKNININSTVGQGGMTALLIAIQQGHEGFVKFLIENKADTNLATDGLGALCCAIKFGKLGIVKLLCAMGFDLVKPNDLGATPLQAAKFYGKTEIIEYLHEQISAKSLGGLGLFDVDVLQKKSGVENLKIEIPSSSQLSQVFKGA